MILNPVKLSGVVSTPPSKSDGQRAVLCAGLAEGTSEIYRLGPSDDEQQMLANIQNIGAEVRNEGTHYLISGTKKFPKECSIHLGESGLGFRLMAGQFAVRGGTFELTASGSLCQRPMGFYQDAFANSGLTVQGTFPPLRMSGKSSKSKFEIDGSQGSQFLSGLLMALPSQDFDSTIRVENLKSVPYVQMTLQTLEAFGVYIESNADRSEFFVKGNQILKATSYTVEGDWSSASCWLALSAVGQNVVVNGLSMQSLQADKGILDALLAANCRVEFQENGLSIDGSKRKPFEFDANHCPDLFPALSVLAACTPGTSSLYGLNRLAVKESDRGKAIQQEFRKLGVAVQLDYENDVMTIAGVKQIRAAEVNAHSDHRIAMCLGALSTVAKGTMNLTGAESVSKSYPAFWDELKRMGGSN